MFGAFEGEGDKGRRVRKLESAHFYQHTPSHCWFYCAISFFTQKSNSLKSRFGVAFHLKRVGSIQQLWLKSKRRVCIGHSSMTGVADEGRATTLMWIVTFAASEHLECTYANIAIHPANLPWICGILFRVLKVPLFHGAAQRSALNV